MNLTDWRVSNYGHGIKVRRHSDQTDEYLMPNGVIIQLDIKAIRNINDQEEWLVAEFLKNGIDVG